MHFWRPYSRNCYLRAASAASDNPAIPICGCRCKNTYYRHTHTHTKLEGERGPLSRVVVVVAAQTKYTIMMKLATHTQTQNVASAVVVRSFVVFFFSFFIWRIIFTLYEASNDCHRTYKLHASSLSLLSPSSSCSLLSAMDTATATTSAANS